MAKKTYIVYHINGSAFMVEATSFQSALKKSGWEPENVISISAPSKTATTLVKRLERGFEASLAEGLVQVDSSWRLNNILQKLGYKAVRETSNMLNPIGKKFFIDADTPSYMDPGSEAYHSM